jgi:hypothetical protein
MKNLYYTGTRTTWWNAVKYKQKLLSLLMPIIILMFLLVKRLETATNIKTLKRKNITNVSKW